MFFFFLFTLSIYFFYVLLILNTTFFEFFHWESEGVSRPVVISSIFSRSWYSLFALIFLEGRRVEGLARVHAARQLGHRGASERPELQGLHHARHAWTLQRRFCGTLMTVTISHGRKNSQFTLYIRTYVFMLLVT